ncbi:aminopeptidase [Limimaricola sp. AA108-03]|uniref:aminopeptidase n=1 Tax=Limimaricola sp. AA108-03 TaxID=3425945 RepID=UPI003D76B7D8
MDAYRNEGRNEIWIKKYAALAVRVGVNLQENQLLIIHSDIRHAELARLVQFEAYEAGASSVFIDWSDQESSKAFLLNADDSAIDHYPEWQAARFAEWEDASAAYIHIISEDPDALQAAPAERISRFQKSARAKLSGHYEKIRSHRVRWCLLIAPCIEWAVKVFPDLPEQEALRSLWSLVLKGSRADAPDVTQAWHDHHKDLGLRKSFLNESQFSALRFTSDTGTDLLVGLPRNHIYIGGGVVDDEGVVFFPNMPTEELFTAPSKFEVNGKLVATKPLIYEGRIIDEFSLVFESGRIVSYHANRGQKVLRDIIETDEGSRYLGEIALASNKSPLAESNTLFHNTLFDENTGCHVGIGNASPSNLSGGKEKSKEELEAAGLNSSLLTVNVTFGADDMKAVGIKDDGTEVLLMKDGVFQF